MKKILSIFFAVTMCVYAQDVHNGVAAITPKSQAEKYMDQVDLS